MNAIFVGWTRSVPGREAKTVEHFGEFVQFLSAEQQAGRVSSFEPVLLMPHGGDLGGFFLIKGEPAKLAELQSGDAWRSHVTRGLVQLEGFGVITAAVGDQLQQEMTRFTKFIGS